MSIAIKNLCKKYGEQQVLNNVNFEIGSAEVVGFIGPNGAGKSTTMKIITGFVPYTEGSVKVCGIEVGENPIETKRLIGYLPEHNPLYLEMYVKEYLRFVGEMNHLSNLKSRVDEMVERVGLTKEYKKRIGQLSKGYRQRVGLAQALIHDPKVLILDEPTTGLDPNQLIEVRNLISEIGKEKTVMLSTHIMQEVSAICDRVVIINGGRIVADKKEEEILSTSTDDNTNILIVELKEDVQDAMFTALNGVNSVLRLRPGVFQLTCSGDVRSEVSKAVFDAQHTLLSLRQQERDMEEVFHELTGANNLLSHSK